MKITRIKKLNNGHWVGYVLLPAESRHFSPWLRPLVDRPAGPTIYEEEADGHWIAWGSRCVNEADCDRMLLEVEDAWRTRATICTDLVRRAVSDQLGWKGWWNRIVAALLLR